MLFESKSIISYNKDLASYIYSNSDLRSMNNKYDEDTFPSIEDVWENYDEDAKESDYWKIIHLLQTAVEKYNVSFYGDLIELSSNPTLYNIKKEISDQEYSNQVSLAADEFESETGVSLYFEGRSGRHVCVENTADNFINYNYLKEVQKQLEDALVNYINSDDYERDKKQFEYDMSDLSNMVTSRIDKLRENLNESDEMESMKDAFDLLSLRQLDEDRTTDGEDVARLLEGKMQDNTLLYLVVTGFYFNVEYQGDDYGQARRVFDSLTWQDDIYYTDDDMYNEDDYDDLKDFAE